MNSDTSSPSHSHLILTSPDAFATIRQEVSEAIHRNDAPYIQNTLHVIANSKDISKASAAIFLKNTLDLVEKEGLDKQEVIKLLDEMIAWAEQNKRKLLRLDFKMRKAETLLALKEYKECLALILETAKILKQEDDKLGLVKLYYLESKVYYELKNLPRAKSSLTQSKSTCTFVYCPPFLQAKIDLLNGVYLADERDYKTATSHILEALEGFSMVQNKEMAAQCARYLILMKIMENKTSEAKTLMGHKLVVPYQKDVCIEMLGKINECVAERNLKDCNEIIQTNIKSISHDQFLINHLVYLCDTLIDSNILKIIEPYSNVNVEYIGNQLGFDMPTIENRLRRMILDSRIDGTIDQETMCISIKRQVKGCHKEQAEMEDILNVLSEATNTISATK
ncbi:26S proteasome regulatory subunit N6 [Nematocida homosporus]|uniref:26S proteasome regulatory subunit N6 n=1 Tax=Nematocida homosporus TaxID=1912981 RepID=UPI002220AE0D|nr:26S proteasome regulatory subunit N6 [Nematocida homosporus]KAI5187565.1 26S proteasome regulatory subunit N6 [Nematocida homosporus]